MIKRSGVVVRSVAVVTAVFAITCSRITDAATPTAEPTPPPRPVQIDKNSVLILIRTTLVAVQQANQTGNYSVLYSISAPGFQSVNSPDRLSQIFANLRAKNFDLSGVVVLEPQLLVMPEMYSNGVMRMAGFFPSVPLQVLFDLQFIPVAGQWRLVAISVDVGTSTPAAPSVATSQPTAVKPAATPSPSVELNIKPKPSATASATPEIKN
ncbi:MAG TPA: hypothetical protein VEP30_13275 [Chthoniobacterales bacterium]|nr:hypothetical protein [Chthoniobacterales bacterium]